MTTTVVGRPRAGAQENARHDLQFGVSYKIDSKKIRNEYQ
jgi:hypothetical protein